MQIPAALITFTGAWSCHDLWWRSLFETNYIVYKFLILTENYLTLTIQSILLFQDRFLLSNSSDSNSSWWIPLSYTTKQEGEAGFYNTKPKLWLNRRQKTGTIDGLNPADWLLFNINQTGWC